MLAFSVNKMRAQELKKMYPTGTRIKIIKSKDRISPIETGTKGTVLGVDDIGTIHVTWDNGRTLGLIEGEDIFEVTDDE